MRRNLLPRHRGSRCYLHDIVASQLFPWPLYTIAAAPTASVAALGRHLIGRRPLAVAAALKGGSPGRGTTPCGLTAGNRLLRPRHGRSPLTGVAYARRRRPCRRQPCPWVATAAGGYPLQGGCPCKGLWPWSATLVGGLGMAGHPCRGPGRGQPPLS
ncbi:hypothetical protein GW17_00056832 [Ensete ventricosum]|nr:hypothetical protein GW17_00056832 [Ensete ventricosum]